MPSQSTFSSAEEITSLHHVAFNSLLLGRSALDLLHLKSLCRRRGHVHDNKRNSFNTSVTAKNINCNFSSLGILVAIVRGPLLSG